MHASPGTPGPPLMLRPGLQAACVGMTGLSHDLQVALPRWANTPGKVFCLAGLLKIMVIVFGAVPWAGAGLHPRLHTLLACKLGGMYTTGMQFCNCWLQDSQLRLGWRRPSP